MRQESVFRRVEIYVAAAAIAAHAHSSEGFRQRDLRFLIELCSNWTENILGAVRPVITNTQVSRYLALLVREGLAKKHLRSKQPAYHLTRLGLIELLSRMTNREFPATPDQFLFVYYFLVHYRSRVIELIQREGKLFPVGVRLELEALLDADALKKAELQRLERMLLRLESRRTDGIESARLASKLFRGGESTAKAVREIENRFPYELNSQKPLSELIGEMPDDVARWELEFGSLHRVSHLWNPAKELLKSYIRVLRTL